MKSPSPYGGGDFLSPDTRSARPGRRKEDHPSQMQALPRGDYFPRLKSGVLLTRLSDRYFLGLPTHGLLLESGLPLLLASNFDGSRSGRELAGYLHCSVEEVADFVRLLVNEDLLELLEEPRNLAHTDLSSQIIAMRRDVESSLLSHRAEVSDGGRDELNKRAEVSILISGENRLGRHLLVALQASGFTMTRLVRGSTLSPRIGGADICGIVTRTGDIGKLRRDFMSELLRNSQIERAQSAPKNSPDLIISTAPIEWDYVQRWMSEGSVHLHVNQIIGREIEVGPLVKPGVSPCLRCVALIKRDNGVNGLKGDYTSGRVEVSSATAAFLSGLLALAVGEYMATEKTPLLASSHWYDLLQPLRPPEVRHWNFHPECGCR